MNFLITHDEGVALVFSCEPSNSRPAPKFYKFACSASSSPTRLTAPCQPPKQCFGLVLVNPQNNVLGWSGLVMSRPMYQMLSTSPFCLLSDPGPQAVYYGARVPILNANGDSELDTNGNPTYVLIPALNRATQATIGADYVLRRKYWLSYLNI